MAREAAGRACRDSVSAGQEDRLPEDSATGVGKMVQGEMSLVEAASRSEELRLAGRPTFGSAFRGDQVVGRIKATQMS